jgi:uncharacterized RDD family membrane protein YckC
VYASWWSRLGAELLDGFVVIALVLILSRIAPALELVVSLGAGFLYNGLLDGGQRGQTVGKRALGIRVVDVETGTLIGNQRGFMRALLPLAFGVTSILGNATFVLSALAATLDGLWPLWDPQRQSWHDKAAGSVVVRVA